MYDLYINIINVLDHTHTTKHFRRYCINDVGTSTSLIVCALSKASNKIREDKSNFYSFERQTSAKVFEQYHKLIK